MVGLKQVECQMVELAELRTAGQEQVAYQPAEHPLEEPQLAELQPAEFQSEEH